MKISPISLCLTAVFFLPVAHGAEFLRESVAQDYEENLAEMFLHFHRNPELSNLESKTAKRLAAEIRVFGE
jgi:hippurate hydrolase